MKNLNFDLRNYHSFYKDVPATTVEELINSVLFPDGEYKPATEISWEFIPRESLIVLYPKDTKIPEPEDREGWEELGLERPLVLRIEFLFETEARRKRALDDAFSIGESDLIVEFETERNPKSLYVWFT